MVGRHDEVVDRGREVVGRDVGYQAEVGRRGLGRVNRAGGRSSRGRAQKSQNTGEGDSRDHFDREDIERLIDQRE